MIPSQRALAELALRRQEALSRQLAGAQWSSSASLLPSVLRRSIVTVSVCHETLRAFQAAVEDGSQTFDSRPPVAYVGGTSSELRGRYGPVSVSIPIERGVSSEKGADLRMRRAHLALAVDSALIAYRDLLAAPDWISQRKALDAFLEYVSSLDDGEAGGPSPGLKPLAEGARKIRILLGARRQSAEASNVLYRDLESLTVEGMAWSYCVALLAETLRKSAHGPFDVRAAVSRVDDLRDALERPHPPATPARLSESLDERSRRPSERPKS